MGLNDLSNSLSNSVNTINNNINSLNNSINNNINMKATGVCKYYDVSQEGWYRFAKYQGNTSLSIARGSSGNTVIFSIKFNFNYTNNMSVVGILNSSYQKSNITILGDSVSYYDISKIRHTVDISNNNAYLEFYYKSNAGNALLIELINTQDRNRNWSLMDKLELAQETVNNVDIYSTADLVSKEQNVAIKKDLRQHLFQYSGTNKEYAIQDVFYKLPADSEMHFVMLNCMNLMCLIVEKYGSHSYGSILRFGYGDRLTQYRIDQDKWYKMDIAYTESQIQKLV